MAGDVVNIKDCSPLKLYSCLTGNYHAICHYSYNLPLAVRLNKDPTRNKKKMTVLEFQTIRTQKQK